LDAVGALRDVRDGHGDQLLRLARQGAIGENFAPESLERGLDARNELAALARRAGEVSG
jgi:hypothetical protein